MMTLQKKSKRRILTCLSVIGALILTSALVFIGCEDASSPADTTPPATNAPTALMATARNGEVSLSWTAPASGTAVSQYRIYRAEGDSIDGASRLSPTMPPKITETTYIDTTAVNGTLYTYAVRAVNALGAESGNSNTDDATPLAPPNAPTALTASDGDGSVTLSWTAPHRRRHSRPILRLPCYRQ